jgi:heme A synthase
MSVIQASGAFTMTLNNVHDRISIAIVLYTFILALWGLWRSYRKQGVDGSVFGALVICEILILVQALLGVILWISALRPERGFMHVLYGVVTAITIPATYAFTRGRDTRREMLEYGLVLIALVALAGRAILTGR